VKTKIVVSSLLLMMTGCTSAPKLSGYEGPQALTTADVIKYNKDCTGAGMRPNVEYVVKRTDSGKVLVPINVHCEPYYEKGFLGFPEKR
jgi:starvation-inducible outer membrane lipoprotein